MEYFEGTLSTLLEEDFGGEEVYGDEVRIVSGILGVPPTEIIFTHSDIAFEEVKHITNFLTEECALLFDDVLDPNHRYVIFIHNWLKVVYNYAEGGLTTLFIKDSDKLKFEKLINKKLRK